MPRHACFRGSCCTFSGLQDLASLRVIKVQKAAVLFVALTALPFIFGWLEPLGNAYDLSALDIPRGAAFVGVFQNPHAASVALSMSALLASLFALREVHLRQRFYWTLLAVFLVA